nr:MIP/aquaporin family protein [Thermoanaerobacterium thermosaccharolyticum]
MSVFGRILSELFGTMILVLLGDGVVANVVLNKTKGQNSGWIVITTGWAFAVAIPVYITGWIGGAHFNPAVTIGMAVIGKFSWSLVPGYIIAQFLGAFVGAILVYIVYRDHFHATEDKDSKLGVFCTIPAIRNLFYNFSTEVIATAVLLIGILGISNQHNNVGALSAFLVGILIWVIGLTLGGPTGYALNPARDLGPRLAHSVLPIPGKRDSDWGYGLIVPLFGPIIGGILGVLIYQYFISLI